MFQPHRCVKGNIVLQIIKERCLSSFLAVTVSPLNCSYRIVFRATYVGMYIIIAILFPGHVPYISS